ncbi:transformation/transcription domain-associated protein-like [Branchiostoma floridae x Branchiostoma japonicum]
MATPTPHATVISPQDLLAQMNKYRSYAAILADTNQQDEHRLKVAQEISENFESIVTSGQYQSFLEHAIPRFLKVLQEGDTIFVQENPIQQLRKLLLEIIHRIPTNDHFRIYVSKVLSLMFQLIERENEENVLVCLRIIIELHKQFRPQIQPEIQHFLHMVKQIYKDLPANMNAMFEKPINVTLDAATGQPVVLPLSGTVTVQTEKADGSKETLTVLSKGINSLKVLAELPIIVVLMYQLYKQNVHSAVSEFIPLIMNTIVLTPSAQARASPQFNRELYVDFVAAQIKTLSFLAYIIRIYQDSVTTYANQMVKGMLSLLTNCPQEVTHLRKELLIAARHILATDLRNRFVPHIDRLFDEKVLIGTGWTTRETLRPLAYSTLADLVHHVRQHLQLSDLALAVHLFSKNFPLAYSTLADLVHHVRQHLQLPLAYSTLADLVHHVRQHLQLPLAYSTLADLVHHVRQHLQLPDLALAVHLFSKNFPLAYSTLADLVHHVRQHLQLPLAYSTLADLVHHVRQHLQLPLAYSTLADLVHHVRQHLQLPLAYSTLADLVHHMRQHLQLPLAYSTLADLVHHPVAYSTLADLVHHVRQHLQLPLAYSTLADLVHHVRQHLQLPLAYSTLADLVHHVRQHLQLPLAYSTLADLVHHPVSLQYPSRPGAPCETAPTAVRPGTSGPPFL